MTGEGSSESSLTDILPKQGASGDPPALIIIPADHQKKDQHQDFILFCCSVTSLWYLNGEESFSWFPFTTRVWNCRSLLGCCQCCPAMRTTQLTRNNGMVFVMSPRSQRAAAPLTAHSVRDKMNNFWWFSGNWWMNQWASQEGSSPGSWGYLVYLALHFGEQSTLLVSPGSGVAHIEVQPAVLSQLLQNPTTHYLGMINFCTSAVNEICIRVTAVCCNITLSFIENQGPGSRTRLFSAAHGSSWNKLVNAALEGS